MSFSYEKNELFSDWKNRQNLLEKRPRAGGVQTSLTTPFDTYRTQPPDNISSLDQSRNFYSPLQPVTPYGPPGITQPRQWDYPVGYNLSYIQPHMQLMRLLRQMRNSWGVLATVIATRQDQLLRIPWTIQSREKPKQNNIGIEKLKTFFRRPDGQRSYSQWARQITDDLLVLDAPCIYFAKDRVGRPISAERIDPIGIFPLIDDFGRIPQSIVEFDSNGLSYIKRQPAFQQIIKGMPMIDLDASELMYVPMRPRADFPVFGFPPTEQILIEAGEAIRKTLYQFNFWADGTIPDLIVTVPTDWTPRQIAQWQAHFDSILSGNLALKSKVRFLPGGMKPFDIKNSSGESLWSGRDESLIRLCCYAYSVSPAPFIQMMNRSTAQNAQRTAEEEGLFPLMSFWKSDIMDEIIQNRFGFEDLEFVFLPRPEPDGEKQSKIHKIQIDTGLRSRNECRAELGEEPIEGGDVVTISTGNAIIPLTDAAQGKAMPVQGGAPMPATNQPNKVPNSNQNENVPQRGTAKPTTGPSEVIKLSQTEFAEANNNAKGNLHAHSAARLEAGNYRKGHIKLHGLDISIENAPGSIRGKKRDDGSIKWSVKMPNAYGYIKRTTGADGDQVDVYIGKNLDSTTVWVIDQQNVRHSIPIGFDEHKCFLGYKNLAKALKHYLKTRNDGAACLGPVVELTIDEFKTWLNDGDTKSPIADQFPDKIVLFPNNLEKVDTISLATNLLNNYPKQKKKKKSTRWRELSIN